MTNMTDVTATSLNADTLGVVFGFLTTVHVRAVVGVCTFWHDVAAKVCPAALTVALDARLLGTPAALAAWRGTLTTTRVDLCTQLARHGHLAMLRQLVPHALFPPWRQVSSPPAATAAAAGGHEQTLAWLLDRLPGNSDNRTVVEKIAAAAATEGHLDLLLGLQGRWPTRVAVLFGPRTFQAAAATGQVDMLVLLQARFPLQSHVDILLNGVGIGGHVPVLRWFEGTFGNIDGRQRFDGWNVVAAGAARGGHAHMLRLIHDHLGGTDEPILSVVIQIAAKYGHLGVLRWAQELRHARGPDMLDLMVCDCAARNGHVHVLQWARAQTPPLEWSTETCSAATFASNSGDVLQWLRTQDPPCPINWASCVRRANAGALESLAALNPLETAAAVAIVRRERVRNWFGRIARSLRLSLKLLCGRHGVILAACVAACVTVVIFVTSNCLHLYDAVNTGAPVTVWRVVSTVVILAGLVARFHAHLVFAVRIAAIMLDMLGRYFARSRRTAAW
jgi:hypothetical protein